MTEDVLVCVKKKPPGALIVLLVLTVITACTAKPSEPFTLLSGDNNVRRESADWIVTLGEELGATQLFVVAGVGQTTAYVSMHEKDTRGHWSEIMTTPGFIRMASSGAVQEGASSTAVSVYSMNASKGIADDPGCVLQQNIVIADDYLAGAGVAIPEVCMRAVMQTVRDDCVVVVDDLKNLSSETYHSLFGTTGPFFANNYVRTEVVDVGGRQGVCTDGEHYWVSGSGVLIKYDRDWNELAVNKKPLGDFEEKVNHIGDLDVYKDELYIVAEYFANGLGDNIQIAVYDADTLEFKRFLSFAPESGQQECSGIAVNPDTGTLWLCSWAARDSSSYLYRYDLSSGTYQGKVEMVTPPQMIQGIAYYDGSFYMTADDGDAEANAPDHLFRTTIEYGKDTCVVVPEKTFDDVTRQGEIEGLSFDKKNRQLLVLYNRGLRITDGRSRGYYDGYRNEISEVFVYDVE